MSAGVAVGPAGCTGWRPMLALLVLMFAGAPAQGQDDSSPDAIASLLTEGGFNIFWRHTHTGTGMDIIRHTRDPAELADCARQRDLDARGEEDARSVGRGFRARGIPVSEVLASPYCRTLKSGVLAFGAGAVTPEFKLATVCQSPVAAFEENVAWLLRMLATAPPAGGNRVLVSHNCNIRALARWLPEKCAREPEMGDAVVFRPLSGGSGFELVGCLRLAQMQAWATPSAVRSRPKPAYERWKPTGVVHHCSSFRSRFIHRRPGHA